MKNLKFTTIILLSLLSFELWSQSNLPNFAIIYDMQSTGMHPQYRIFHKSDSVSVLILKLNMQEINSVRLNNRLFEAKISIKINFYQSLSSMKIIDTFYKEIVFRTGSINEAYTTTIDLKSSFDTAYCVIITKDLFSKQKSLSLLKFDKTAKSAQNFLLLDSINSNPLINNIVKPNSVYYINSRFREEKFLVKKYESDMFLPQTVSSNEEIEFDLKIKNEFIVNSNSYLKFSDSGVYKISLSSDEEVFFTTINCGESFPFLLYASDLLNPLVYLSSTSEFEKMMLKINKKIAVDDFWMNKAKNLNTAKNLIKIFYSRCSYANIYFSNTTEGWRTDRGMILIIFGAPTSIKKTDNQEFWYYYNQTNGKNIKFTFTLKDRNNLTKDYFLERNSDLFTYWQAAMKAWNEGEIYKF